MMERIRKEAYQRQIKIYYCGREVCAPSHSYGPSVRTHYLMHFVLKGKGTYCVRGNKYDVHKHQAFLIRPYESTLYFADEHEPWEYIWIAFDGGETEQVLEESQLTADRLVCTYGDDVLTSSYLSGIVDCFYKINSLGNISRQREMLGYFYLIFSTINQGNLEVQNTYQFDLHYVRQAKEYIMDNYGYDIHVQDVAHHVGIERTYLYKIFMKYEKQSPKQCLTNYRIRMAKEMLETTDYKVLEIALSSGFGDASIFCKNFLNAVGMTPTSYRQKYRI